MRDRKAKDQNTIVNFGQNNQQVKFDNQTKYVTIHIQNIQLTYKVSCNKLTHIKFYCTPIKIVLIAFYKRKNIQMYVYTCNN